MKYNELIISKQARAQRVGRGISAGKGKTAGRGTKGQGSRKSSGIRAGFEGGQLPLYMRLPHLRGFRSKAKDVEVVYTGQLDLIKQTAIDNESLAESGITSSPYNSVKLLLKGEITSKKEVKLQGASTSAVKAVEKAGGSFQKVARQGRTSTKKHTTGSQ